MNWKGISKCLTAHYADKRDLKILEYQIFSMTQGRLSVVEFYQAASYQLSLILNQIGAQEEAPEAIRAVNHSIAKGLGDLVRGLNGDLPRLLAIKEPNDLSHALHLCSLVENQEQSNSVVPKIKGNRLIDSCHRNFYKVVQQVSGKSSAPGCTIPRIIDQH